MNSFDAPSPSPSLFLPSYMLITAKKIPPPLLLLSSALILRSQTEYHFSWRAEPPGPHICFMLGSVFRLLLENLHFILSFCTYS